MKAKWEGVFAVLLAVTLIFSIEYYYYACCIAEGPGNRMPGIRTEQVIPVTKAAAYRASLRKENPKDNSTAASITPGTGERCSCSR